MSTTTPITQELETTIAVIEAFQTLLEAETQALDNSAFDKVDRLQPQKHDLAKRYQKQVHILYERREEVKKTHESLRTELISARTKLTKLLASNLHALERMKSSCHRLTDHILGAARRALAQKMPNAPQSYGASGRQTSSPDKTLSMSLNQQL